MGSAALKLRDRVLPSPLPETRRFDLFVAAPMEALESRLAFDASRTTVMATIDDLIASGAARQVYYAGAVIGAAKPFTHSHDALEEDLGALSRSSRFLLIYPAKLASGALVELGYAMALKRPVAILVRDFGDLPYFLRHVRGTRRSASSGPVTVRRYVSNDHLSGSAQAALEELAQV